ncbi:MAG: O-antigen ligase family protein [Verrucomicrobiales bacterium]|nr:O-antigen ligase family protein [Verrucomicrobiales bacterium]
MPGGSESAHDLRRSRALQIFSLALGAVLGLGLVKFGNPVILDKAVEWPGNFWEWLLMAWPIRIGYALLAPVIVASMFCVRWTELKLRWAAAVPLAWLLWQLIAGAHTVNVELTEVTLWHFAACVACFYMGYLVLGQLANPSHFFLGVSVGFAFALAMGVDQHFGGLEETRRHFWQYVYPSLEDVPPGLLKRMSSDRIFGTLFYPNSFASAIVLCCPPVLAFLWSLDRLFTPGARIFLVAIFAATALACLVWTGSKGGWLAALVVCFAAVLHLRLVRWVKIGLVVGALAFGLGIFAVRFSGYFARGAPSAVARLDYWVVAAATALDHPLVGTGPGTFQIPYGARKRPEAEMARTAHNDYLQQASDSGLPGFALYALLVVGGLFAAYPGNGRLGSLPLATWLGLLGWWAHNLVEFGLYIPALSWLAFTTLGWLIGRNQKTFDKRSGGR